MARPKPRIELLRQIAARVVAEYRGTSYAGRLDLAVLEAVLIQMGIRAWEAGVRRERATVVGRWIRKAAKG